MKLEIPPGAATACKMAIECNTRHGRFVIGPASHFVEIDLVTECHEQRRDAMFYTKAISLVTHASDYDAQGMLVWLPALRMFGSWDDDHLALYVFPETTLAMILADPEPYVTTQWEHARGVAVGTLATQFDVVPYRPGDTLWDAFQGGGREREDARRFWTPLFGKYPSLRDNVDGHLHREGVSLSNALIHGERATVEHRIAELRAFFGPLVGDASFASIAEAERELAIVTIRERFERELHVDRAGQLAKVVRDLVQLDDRELREQLVMRLGNVLRELLVSSRLNEARELLDAYLAAVPAIGHLTGTSTGTVTGETFSARESLASHAVALTIRMNDDALFARVAVLVPDQITYGVLAFNLASYHALRKHKAELLRFTGVALRLGKTAAQFDRDTDFDSYRGDRDFVAVLAQAR